MSSGLAGSGSRRCITTINPDAVLADLVTPALSGQPHDQHSLQMYWEPGRPHVLVVACSDGRLQEATDRFLAEELGVRQYDRLYVPGGGGALSPSGREFIRAQQLRSECRHLVAAHEVTHLILLWHGPSAGGPAESICADYRRKQSWAPPAQIRRQQDADVRDILSRRDEFAGSARLSCYRMEVGETGELSVATLHDDRENPPASGFTTPPPGFASPSGEQSPPFLF